MQPLYEYVCHMKGHRNSDGELAEWVIKSHETGEILSSHKSEKKAKEHLQHMHIFGESVEGEAACSHCGWSADGVEEYNGRLLCPYCLTQFKWLDEHRDPENGMYEKYDLVPRESKKSDKLIGESNDGNNMDKRVKIFMEGVSQLGLSKNQVDAIGKITKVCMEGMEDGSDLGPEDYVRVFGESPDFDNPSKYRGNNPYDSIEIPQTEYGDLGNDNEEIGSMDFGGVPDGSIDIGSIDVGDIGDEGDLGEIGKISEGQDEQPEF